MRWQILYLVRDFIVAPHTFLKPKSLLTAAPPEIGSRVPELHSLHRGRPTVVAFLRHVGCPFAEATVRRMTALARERSDVDFIAVTHSAEEPSRSWCSAFGGLGGVRLVAAPDRRRYAEWGVGLSDRAHFAGKNSLTALRALLGEGIHNRWASGNRWQSAATFAVDRDGILRWRHFPRHAGELPSLHDALTALGE